MAAPVGYANVMLLGLICKLPERGSRKAALNRLQSLYRATKQSDSQENELILHSYPVLSYI